MSDKWGNQYSPPRGPVLGWDEGRAAAAGTRRLREAAGLHPAELAARLGQGTGWVKGREAGSVRMTRAEAERVAAALGTGFAGLLEAGAQR